MENAGIEHHDFQWDVGITDFAQGLFNLTLLPDITNQINKLSHEHADTFLDIAGDTMVKLGYDSNNGDIPA